MAGFTFDDRQSCRIQPLDKVIINCPNSKNHQLIGEVTNISITKTGRVWVHGKRLHHRQHYNPNDLILHMKAIEEPSNSSPNGVYILHQPVKKGGRGR